MSRKAVAYGAADALSRSRLLGHDIPESSRRNRSHDARLLSAVRFPESRCEAQPNPTTGRTIPLRHLSNDDTLAQ